MSSRKNITVPLVWVWWRGFERITSFPPIYIFPSFYFDFIFLSRTDIGIYGDLASTLLDMLLSLLSAIAL